MKTQNTDPAPLVAAVPAVSLASFVGKQIGWLRVTKPVVRHNASYECAAWWSEETSAIGVFPLVLGEDPYNKGTYYAAAALPAKFTDAYFGSLFGGVAIGTYDKARDVGRECTVYHRVNLPALVHGTGSPTDDLDYVVLWEHVPAIIAHWQARSLYWFALAGQVAAGTFGFVGGDPWSSLAHYAQWAAEHARDVSEMQRYLGYHVEGTFADCECTNLAWVPTLETA